MRLPREALSTKTSRRALDDLDGILNAGPGSADHQEGKLGLLRGLSCVVTAYFVYTVLNLVAVAITMDQMQEHREVLQRNVQDLKEVNRRLQAEFDELSTSSDLIRLYARGIGLYAPGERVIRLQGVGEPAPFYEVGDLVPQLDSPRSHRSPFLLAGIATGGLLYARLRFRERSRSDRDSPESPEDHADLLSNASSRRVDDPSR